MGLHPRDALSGPIGLLLYVLADKEPRPGEHARFIARLWKQNIGSLQNVRLTAKGLDFLEDDGV